MTKLGFFLKTGPFTSSRGETVYNLATAALDKGIQVFIFLDLDAVLQPIESQHSLEVLEVPKMRFSELIEKGAKVYVCGTCLNVRGLYDPDLFREGIIKTGNMEDLAAIMSDVDRIVSL